MKPIKLEMDAFGSYAQHAAISFEEFKSGLYLITGDTGAGKTTIFDAIMIALFGEASGKSETKDGSRSFEKLHSDHVEKKVDSRVKLEFSQGDKVYTVERTLHFTRTRGKENEYGKASVKALLFEPGKDPIEKETAVNKRIREIIGMDGEKFRKVVMLAQGEFRKFLQADSETKGQILGDLFDSSIYMYYQNLLGETRSRLREIRKSYEEEVTAAMKAFQNPDETCEDYLTGSPELTAALQRLVTADEEEAGRLQLSCQAAEKVCRELTSAREMAKQDNANLEALEEAIAERDRLNGEKGTMADLQTRTAGIRDAYYQVLPKEKKVRECRKALADLETDMKRLDGEIERGKKRTEECETACKADQPKKQEIEARKLEIKKISDSLPDYQTLSEAMKKQTDARKQQTEENAKRVALEQTAEKLRKQIEELEAEKKDYASVDRDLAAAEQRQKDTGARRKLLDQPGSGVIAGHQAIRKAEKELEKLHRNELDLLEEEGAAFDHYTEQNRRFLNGQAGILAQQLGETLEKEQQAHCPVCRTLLFAKDRGQLAAKPEMTPSEDEVKEANAAYEKVRKQRTNHQNLIRAKETALEKSKEHLLQQLRDHCPECESWEQLDADGFLAGLLEAWKAEEAQAGADWKAAQKRKAAAEKADRNLNDARKLQTGTQELLTQSSARLAKLAAELAAAESTIETLRPKLKYESRKAAEEEKKRLEKQKTALEAEVEQNERALKQSQQLLAGLEGSQKKNLENLPVCKAALEAAGEAFAAALEEYSLVSEDALHELLNFPNPKKLSTEKWIKEQESTIQNYRLKCEKNRTRIEGLQKQTEGKRKADLAAMQEQIDEAEQKKADCDKARTNHAVRTENHKTTCERVTKAKGELARTDRAWARIDRLGDMAAAVSSTKGGRLSFERYVMGAVFAEILDMANLRLQVMTGGRYELIPRKPEGKAYDQTGFQINVLDHTTDKERPSETLSGGESFMASLALALGLSDVVQNHEGGVQIDSLFIDEGFGTLDDGVLDKAIDVLKQLAEGNRLVGIISHVSKLESSIPDRICVRSSEKGSRISLLH